MPYKFRRVCPICYKQELLYLSDHLRKTHGLSIEERQPWLKAAIFSHQINPMLLPRVQSQESYIPTIVQPSEVMSQPKRSNQFESPRRKQPKVCLESTPYPDFKFNHMFSMLVVGPSQSGKTYFVEQLLTNPCVSYPNKKPRHIYWFYNQWQPRYKSLQSALGNEIQFTQGLPELSEDLRELNPKFNNVLVFDDLMAQATDSPILSKLFTQGRHRNASVILLLQNMFPKGKFNTDISRNAQYMVLFRSPSDRKQIDIIAERIFAKDRPTFMEAYNKETAKPFGYILIDNQPKTTVDKQVVSSVFDECRCYPKISVNSLSIPEKRKAELEELPTKKPKREVKTNVVKKPQKRQPKAKPKKPKANPKRPLKKATPKRQPKKPTNTQLYEIYNAESNSDNETDSEREEPLTEEELIAYAAKHRPHTGFGP